MTIRTVLLAGACLALIAGVSGAAEFPTDRVYAFFSASPTLDAIKKPLPGESGIALGLRLRPNVEQSAYVYVYNPKEDDASVTVILSSGFNAGGEIARSAIINVPSKQVVKVSLAGRAAAAPVTPKAGVESPPAGTRVDDGSKLWLHVEEKTDKPGKVEPKEYEKFDIEVPRPDRDSIFTVEATVPKDGALAVKVKFVKQKDSPLFTTKPAKVRLDLRPDFNEKLDAASLGQGTFEAEVQVGDEATLYAEGVKFLEGANEQAIAFVSVDGYERTFRVKTDFKSSPEPQTSPIVNVRLSSTAQVPGKPVIVTVEADDESNDTVLVVDRMGDKKTFEPIRHFGKKSRDKAIYVSVGGEGDAVKLHPVVKDWAVEFATANVAGVRTFEVRNGNVRSARSLLIDRTAPVKAALVLPAKDKLLVGTEQTLKATAEDAESGIAAVYFFLGEAPNTDGKPAPGSKVVKGEKQADGSWATKEPLRLPEQRGDVKIGALFVNGVGLASPAEATAYVREPEKAKEEKEKEKKTTGSIEGVVMHSIRPQPDLPVTLKDSAGKELKKTTTDSGGNFKFKDLPPGEYTVSSVKRADLNSNGSQTVTVEAGDKPTKAEIVIRR
jgi:hypothetical protein